MNTLSITHIEKELKFKMGIMAFSLFNELTGQNYNSTSLFQDVCMLFCCHLTAQPETAVDFTGLVDIFDEDFETWMKCRKFLADCLTEYSEKLNHENG